MSQHLFDSKPFATVEECSKQRFISKFDFRLPYLVTSPVRANTRKSYKNFLEVGVRNFIKGYLGQTPCFGLRGDEFNRYNDLMNFIYGFDQAKDIKLSKQALSNLKHRKIIIRPVPNTRENVAFVKYIKETIPYFDGVSFLK